MATALNPFMSAGSAAIPDGTASASVLCNCGCGQPIHPNNVQRGIRYLRGHKTSPQAAAPPQVYARDLPVTALLAGVTGDCDTSPVVLSGRCPACGYLRASAGHKITCG